MTANSSRQRPGLSPVDLEAPRGKLIGGQPQLIPVGISQAEEATAATASFGALLGAAAARNQDSAVLEDPIVKELNAVAETVRVSDEMEQRIITYAVRTIELSKGQFDFRVNYRFENPKMDLVSAGEGVLFIQGYRDRLCQLEIELRQAKKKLDSAYDSGMEYLFEVHASKMESFGRDTERRKIFTSKVFKPLLKKLTQVRSLLEQIKSALENLDKAHFAYKEVVEVGKTILNRVEGRAGA